MPNTSPIYIGCCPFFQKGSHFLQFAPTGARVIEQIAELRRVGFDNRNIFLEFGVTFQD